MSAPCDSGIGHAEFSGQDATHPSLVPRPPRPARSATRSSASAKLDAYAAAAPGLEPLVAGELHSLGITSRIDVGGVGFTGTFETVARANVWLRTASRVIVRVAFFRAQAFYDLERLARAVPWEQWVNPGGPVRFRITSRKSRLYHTGAIAQRFTEAIEHRLGRAPATQPATAEDDEEEGESAAQLFVIRVVHDAFTVSADSSGALLHQRGYRQAIAKAPLRETLAAAMLLGSNWSGDRPLMDPLCGSGTIPIEAALIARRMAPGLHRTFAFSSWPQANAATWNRVREQAESAVLPRAQVRIQGSDRDRGAIEAALANAGRAGVEQDVELTVRALSAMDPGSGEPGYVVTNPPYGVRVGEATKLRDLYARFGDVLRTRCPAWRLAMLSANPRLEGELRLRLQEQLRTQNGGIPVRLLMADVPPLRNRQPS